MLCLAFCSFRPTEAARDSSDTGPAPKSAGRSTDMRIFRPTGIFYAGKFLKEASPGRNLNYIEFWAGYKF